MTNQTQWTNNIDRALEVDGEAKVNYIRVGRFEVQSATSERVYRVTLQHVDGEPVTNCNCRAGEFGRRCWHQAEALLMAGELDVPQPEPEVDLAVLGAALLSDPLGFLTSR